MLVVTQDAVINLDMVHNFQKFYGKIFMLVFSNDSERYSIQIDFESEEDLNEAYQGILFAYAEGKKVYAITKNKKD